MVDALPKLNPSNDLMEGVNGMRKQFLRKRPNARAVLASSYVAYKASGMADRVQTLDASAKRRGCHYAMQEARKKRKTGTKRIQMETHGLIQRKRAQQEAERVRGREERREEQKTGLEALQRCESEADLRKLLKRPPAYPQFSTSTKRRQRIIDQLKRLRLVDKVKVPAYSGKGKTIPVLWSMLCRLLGLEEIPLDSIADETEVEEPMDEVQLEPEGDEFEGELVDGRDIEMEDAGENGNEQQDNSNGQWKPWNDNPFINDGGMLTADNVLALHGGDLFAPDELVEQAIAGDEFAFAEVVYRDGWEEFSFGSLAAASGMGTIDADLGPEFDRRLSFLEDS